MSTEDPTGRDPVLSPDVCVRRTWSEVASNGKWLTVVGRGSVGSVGIQLDKNSEILPNIYSHQRSLHY